MPDFIETSGGIPVTIPSAPTPQPPKPEIAVSTLTPPAADPAATPAPKKGSAKESIFKDLRAKFGVETPPPVIEAKAELEQKAPEPEQKPPVAEQKPPTPEQKAEQEKQAKANPWKLVEEYKSKSKALEERLSAAEKAGVSPEKLQMYEAEIKKRDEEIQKREAKLAEYEKEIRYKDYQKSEHFKKTYQEPYEKAWKDSLEKLAEVTIEEDDGSYRPVTEKDFTAILGMNLRDAKQFAEEKYGVFKEEILACREKVNDALKAQVKALDEAKNQSAEFYKKQSEEKQKQRMEMTESVRKVWTQANEAALKDPKHGAFFTPIEGDAEGNQKLAKGYELADRAFSENIDDPRLTNEQRKEMVARKAAVRNRAAAYGRLVHQVTKGNERIAELEAKLKQYTDTEPPQGGGAKPPATAGKVSAKQSIFEELRKRAK
jgi:hypothetical protein